MLTLPYAPARSSLWNPLPSNTLITVCWIRSLFILPNLSPNQVLLTAACSSSHTPYQARSWKSPGHLMWHTSPVFTVVTPMSSATHPSPIPLGTWASGGWLTTNSFILQTSMAALWGQAWTSTPSGSHTGWWLNATSPHTTYCFMSPE